MDTKQNIQNPKGENKPSLLSQVKTMFGSKKSDPDQDTKESAKNQNVSESKKESSAVFQEVGSKIFGGKDSESENISPSGDNGPSAKSKGKDPITKFFILANTCFSYLLLTIATFSFGAYAFFTILLDSENQYLSKIGVKNLGTKIVEAETQLKQRRDTIDSLNKKILQTKGKVPQRIYFKSDAYTKLPEDLKDELLKYYDIETGNIKFKGKNTKPLSDLFLNNPKLNSLKLHFEKQYVLNEVIENRIFWKNVYNRLQEATNAAFRYNDILNYITYENFSVDEEGKISVSGNVVDPSGKVFSQLISLVNTINNHDNFHGANIATFKKTENKDESVGGMVSPINLSFYYNE